MKLRKQIGLVLAPGCRAADVLGLEGILGLHVLRHELHYVAASPQPVRMRPDLQIVPTTTFEQCPQLDVLVVGELDEDSLEDAQLLAFITRAAAQARLVLGVASGVRALAKCELLEGRAVTADAASLVQLREAGIDAREHPTALRDGPIVSAGPSTGALEAAYLIVRELVGDFGAKFAELNLEYHPEQRFHDPALTPAPPPTDAAPLEVAVLTAPGMYAPDIAGSIDALGALPEARFRYVWKEAKPVRTVLGPTLVADTSFENCPPADVLVLGANMPALNDDEQVLDFLRQAAASARAIICVCAGSLLIGSAGLLEGQRATSNFHMVHMLPDCKVEACHETVVASGKFYSAGPAIGAYETALLAIAELHGPEVAAFIEREHLEYRPQPPFGVGTPSSAGALLTWISRASLAGLLPAFRRRARRGYQRSRRAGAAVLAQG